MAKQLNVNLAFTADTGKAKAQLQDLNRQLERLISGQGVKNLDLGITKEINEGISAAASLKAHLQDATNVNTGKLDLTKFTQSLQKSGKTLDDYAKNLQKLGPQGSEAFLSLARSISNAEVPLVRVNKKLEEMWTTLKNTARWQISSSILHGFMGSVQSAFGYAEDLNESLNNIRIVTGQNVDQMADFAKQANKAAKALSTTTTEYTNASLIYYQQGLSEEEVLERADVTVKMANVANQSAEIVSDQMTAVWNNFYDGSKSLEYYADVMTALGAATASSTDEIAGGLEKFAAIADTIGLSYEYAASALATITSNTRQSEEVVGTALKTIFARIQGLNLGETLEDGVTLNKYSEALNKVGISIFEQNGELKAMDNILNEMGDKWGSLNKAQQTALAQTVAGVRQYNQLISLMDNWDKGDSDSFQANLKTVEKAEGALDEQADIYAESWEAASDRVRAAAEAIYSNLINDEFFIDLLVFGADALTTIDKIMDSLGGMPGILSVISAIILKTFRGKIVDEIEGMTSALVSLTDMEGAKMKSQATKKEAYKKAAELATKGTDKSDPLSHGNIRAKHIQDEAMLQDILLDKSNQLNELQLKEFQTRLDGLRVMQEEAELQAKTVEREKEKTEELVRRQKLLIIGNKKVSDEDKKRARENLTRYENLNKGLGAFDKMTYQAAKGNKTYTENDIKKIIDISGNSISGNIKKELHNLIGKTASEAIDDVLEIYTKIEYQAGKAAQNLIDAKGINLEQKNLDEIAKSAQKTGAEINDLTNKTNNLDQMAKDIEGDLNSASASTITWRDTLVQSAEGIVSITGGIIALKGAFNSLSEAMEDGNLSMDEFIGVCTSLSIALPSLISGVKALGAVQTTNTAGTLAATVAQTKLGTAVTAVAGHFGIALGPVGAFVAVLASVAFVATILAKFIDDNIVTQEEAYESIKKANEAYAEQKQVVDDLNNTLQTTKDRIDELNNKDTLTIVEQEELERLKEQVDLLERQKALEEKHQKDLEAQAAESIGDNFGANYSLGVQGASIAKAQQQVNAREQTLDEVKASLKEEFEAGDLSEEEYLSSVKEVEKAYKDSISSWYDENRENIQNAEQNYLQYAQAINSGLITLDESKLEEMQTILQGIRKNLYSSEGEYFNFVIKPIFESEAFQKSKEELLDSLHVDPEKDFTFSKDIEKQLRVAGISAEEFSTQLKQIYTNADEILKTVEAPADFIKSLSFEDLQIINESNFDTTEFDEFYRKFLEVKNQKESLVLNIQIARDTAKDALNTLASGDFLSEEQLTNLEEHFRELYDLSNLVNMSMYDQAKAISSALLNATIPEAAINNTINKVGELREALGKLQEEEEALAEAGKELDDDKRKQKIELEVELDQAKKDLESLKFDPIELSVEIDNSLIDGLMAQAGAIDKATSLISEGFKVEAKNVSELVKTMPELFENATVDIKTGIVQLQNDIVNKTIETAKAETEVERQGLIERLNARITYLNGSIDSLNTLRQVAEANSNATKLKEEINSKLTLEEKKASAAAIIKAKIQQAIQEQTQSAKTASHVIQDQKQITDASKVESETLYANWQQALSEFNEAAFNAFKNASVYQTQFTNNETVTRQALDAKTTIAGRGSSYQWNSKYDDTAVGNQYSQLQDFVDSGFDFSKVDIDHSNDIQAQIAKTQIQEQFKDLFGIDLTDASVWGSGESFLDQFFGMYTTSGALLDDIGLGTNDLQYELAEAIEQLSKTTSFDGALGELKKAGTFKNEKDYKAEIERYHEITRAIENQERALDDLSNAKDEAFGANKISLMEQELAQMEALKAKQQQLLTDAEKYLALDKAALMSAYPGAKIDANTGEILNFEELQRNTTSEEQNKILEQYESTIDKINEAKDALEESERQIKALNYEKLSYNLELKLDINDAELQKLEYFLNKYSDDFYKMAESIALMTDKIEPVKNNLEDYRAQDEALSQAYEKGKISQEAYIEGLKEVREGYYENLEALNELNKEMLEYYENTLSAAKDELNDYTDHMEHLTGVLDHYLNLMDILGKQKDYDAIGNFLNGKASITRDRLDVAKDYYQILLEQKEIVKAELNAAIESGDEALIKLHQKEWDAIVDATDEAQEEVLSLTEEWAQSMQEIIKNNMTKIADELEKSLTNGFGFDFLLDQWDRINTQQEEYLDKTNQIYETNKMMRTAQKALDETTNKVAKQKLKNFIEETARLQENTKLSKHELEIRQAQYDLLLAEIALEEAQNAKSTVRLSRDSEGNFGYIYTADEDKVNEAEQNLDDKRNNIYNLSLEGQKEYMDKYLQASKEMNDELKELQEQYLGGLLTEEEFKLRSEAIKKYYLGSSEFQKAMADLEEEYRRGNLGSEEEYNRLRQEIIRKYSAEDIGILNQYLDIANTSNRIAREEDAKLQQKYQDENIISQEEYYKKKAEMIKSFNENMATLDKAYYEDGALTEAEYNQLRENLTNKFHNDMKELNNTYYQDGIENENKFNQEKEALTNKYHSDLKALNDAFYIDGTISEEEYNNERNALTKKYHDDINALTKDYYKTGLEDDKNYNKEKAELIDTFANDSKGVLGDFFDFYLDKTESTGDNASESWGDNLGNMAHSTSDWSDDVNDYLDEVEEGAEDMRDVYEEVNEDLEDALENSAETTEDLKDESDDLRKEIKNKVIPAIKDEIKEVKELTTKYGLQKDELDELINKYEDYLDLIGEEIEHHSVEIEEPKTQTPEKESEIESLPSEKEEKPVNNSEAKKIAKEAQEIINKVHYGKDGMTEGNNGWAPNARKKGYSEEAIAIAKKAFNDSKDGSGYSYFYEEALKLAGQYNTGGYTGAWGPEGKLAFLHEKELILNKDDTENILNTVSFIRDIVSMIDNKANMSSLFSMSAMAGITSGNMGMEQQVTIYAEFPDATDHNEIEQAFNSLLNTASQYANRK